MVGCRLACLEPVVGFADDRQAVVLQQAAQRGAHGGGVVGDQHAGGGMVADSGLGCCTPGWYPLA